MSIPFRLGDYHYYIPVRTLPCLSLHRECNFFALHQPSPIACPWNVRKPRQESLGINVAERDKDAVLLNRLSKESADQELSVLDGNPIQLALTSFVTVSAEDHCDNILLFDYVVGNKKLDLKIKAVPLTIESLQKAIKWLRKDKKQSLITSVVEGTEMYLKTLSEVIPDLMAFDDMLKFVRERTWKSHNEKVHNENSCLKENWEFFIQARQEHVDEHVCTNNRLRQFIHDHVAWETGVVAHVIQGLHRLTALDFLFVGWNLTDNNVSYGVNNPHKNKFVQVRTTIPQGDGSEFVQHLTEISARSQNTSAKLQEHSLIEFLKHELQSLHGRAPYLYHPDESITDIKTAFQLQVDDVEGINELLRSEQPEGLELTGWCDIPVAYLRNWVQRTSEKVAASMVGSNLLGILGVNTETLSETLQLIFHDDFDSNLPYDIFPFKKKWTLVGFIQTTGKVFPPSRFGKNIHARSAAVAFILLWSRLSSETYDSLLNWLQNLSIHAVSTSSSGDEKEEKARMVENFFNSVVASVWYSYPVWKKCFFNKPKEIQESLKQNQPDIIRACLLMSSISECGTAFNQMSQLQVDLDQYKTLVEGMKFSESDFPGYTYAGTNDWGVIEAKYNVPFPDMVTFFVVAHAIHMDARLVNLTGRKKFTQHPDHDKVQEILKQSRGMRECRRNPFGRMSTNSDKFLVSIIGCKEKYSDENKEWVSTRLADFLPYAIRTFDITLSKKEYFCKGILQSTGKKFCKVIPEKASVEISDIGGSLDNAVVVDGHPAVTHLASPSVATRLDPSTTAITTDDAVFPINSDTQHKITTADAVSVEISDISGSLDNVVVVDGHPAVTDLASTSVATRLDPSTTAITTADAVNPENSDSQARASIPSESNDVVDLGTTSGDDTIITNHAVNAENSGMQAHGSNLSEDGDEDHGTSGSLDNVVVVDGHPAVTDLASTSVATRLDPSTTAITTADAVIPKNSDTQPKITTADALIPENSDTQAQASIPSESSDVDLGTTSGDVVTTTADALIPENSDTQAQASIPSESSDVDHGTTSGDVAENSGTQAHGSNVTTTTNETIIPENPNEQAQGSIASNDDVDPDTTPRNVTTSTVSNDLGISHEQAQASFPDSSTTVALNDDLVSADELNSNKDATKAPPSAALCNNSNYGNVGDANSSLGVLADVAGATNNIQQAIYIQAVWRGIFVRSKINQPSLNTPSPPHIIVQPFIIPEGCKSYKDAILASTGGRVEQGRRRGEGGGGTGGREPAKKRKASAEANGSAKKRKQKEGGSLFDEQNLEKKLMLMEKIQRKLSEESVLGKCFLFLMNMQTTNDEEKLRYATLLDEGKKLGNELGISKELIQPTEDNEECLDGNLSLNSPVYEDYGGQGGLFDTPPGPGGNNDLSVSDLVEPPLHGTLEQMVQGVDQHEQDMFQARAFQMTEASGQDADLQGGCDSFSSESSPGGHPLVDSQAAENSGAGPPLPIHHDNSAEDQRISLFPDMEEDADSDFNQFLRQLGDEYEEFQQQLDTEYDRICD